MLDTKNMVNKILGKNTKMRDSINFISRDCKSRNSESGKVLMTRDNGTQMTERDYVDYFLDNNEITDTRIKAIKEGRTKVMGSIPQNIWLEGLKERGL